MKKTFLIWALFCNHISCFAFSELGEISYHKMWNSLERKEYENLIETANKYIDSNEYTNEDRVHFYVILLSVYMEKSDTDSWNKTKKKLDQLINSDESAFVEFRSFYDC